MLRKKTIKKKISLMYHPAFSDTHSDIMRAFLRIRIRGTCNVGQRGCTCWITREQRSNVTGVIARASPNIQEEMSPPSCGSTVLSYKNLRTFSFHPSLITREQSLIRALLRVYPNFLYNYR